MPGGVVNSVLNATSKFAKNQSQYILIAIVLAMILIIYSKRLFQIKWEYFSIVVTSVMLLLMSLIIISTFLHVLQISDSYGYIDSFNHVFNSPSSVNFFAIIMLLLFVIYLYELPQYDNNNRHAILDTVTLGHNSYISNRTMGIGLIFGFAIFTAYTVMLTTRSMSV